MFSFARNGKHFICYSAGTVKKETGTNHSALIEDIAVRRPDMILRNVNAWASLEPCAMVCVSISV